MAKILEFFRRGKDRFDELIKPHLNRLYGHAYRFTGSEAEAEELLQDLLVKLYAGRYNLGQIEHLGAWLTRSLYHHFIDRQRRAGRDPASLGNHAVVEEAIESATDDPRHAAEQYDLRQQLDNALNTLDAEQRALVALHDMEGMPLHEIAQMLEIPLGTVKSRLHRARARLRRYLELEPFPINERYKDKGEIHAVRSSHKTP